VVTLSVFTGERLWAAPSFFPNSVHLSGSGIVVTAEHLDAVVLMSPENGSVLGVLAGCVRADVHRDPALDPVREMGSRGLPGCSGEAQLGERDLRSPNDAVVDGEMLYVADTDHHRVVAFRAGRWVGDIGGFNSPVSLRSVPRGR
jgi:hypothetical protein